MNMKSKKFSLYALVALIGALSACGSKTLSRNEAATRLKEGYPLPQIMTVELRNRLFKNYSSTPGPFCVTNLRGEYPDYKSLLDELQAKGLITLENTTRRDRYCTFLDASVSLSAEGRKYLVREEQDYFVLRTHALDLGEITGIMLNEQAKTAQVEYTVVVVDMTPFGGIRGFSHVPDKAMRKSTTFSLYDDGWRIQN